jgi:site-specific DNA recombinase
MNAKSPRRRRKVALYGRVSSVRQALVVDGGLDTQFSQMERQVALWDDTKPEAWEIVERYREEGRTGKNLDRPEFKRLMADIKAGRIDTVVVQKIDRISRSLRDFYDLWEMFQQHDVHFVSLKESFDTTSAVGRAMLKLILVFAELEREQTGERTKATLQYRASTGLWGSGRPPRGYKRHGTEKGVLVLDPDEAKIVRTDMFERVLELGSAQGLVRELNTRGIHQQRFTNSRGQKKGGGRYSTNVICHLLVNPVYLGKIRFDGEIFEGRHEAIVSQELFDQVQAMLNANRVRRGPQRSQKEHVFLLEGLMRCGDCGSSMTPIWSTGANNLHYHYYGCCLRQRTSGTACSAGLVPAEEVEQFLLRELRSFALSDDEIDYVVERANGDHGVELRGKRKELTALRRRRGTAQQHVDELIRAVEGGGGFSSAIQSRLTALEAEGAELDVQVTKLEEEVAALEQVTVKRDDLAEVYTDFPAIWNRLIADGDRYDLRAQIRRMISVAEWSWDSMDKRVAQLDLGLFHAPKWEEQMGLESRTAKHPLPVSSGCSLKLPGLDSNLDGCSR